MIPHRDELSAERLHSADHGHEYETQDKTVFDGGGPAGVRKDRPDRKQDFHGLRSPWTWRQWTAVAGQR